MFGFEEAFEERSSQENEDAMLAAFQSNDGLLEDGEEGTDQEQLEKRRQNITMEVIEFFDAYKTFGRPIESLQQSLQSAIDGGSIPKKFDLRGNKVPELKFNRVDDKLAGSIFKSIGNISFLSELDLSFNEIGDRGALEIAEFLKADIALGTLVLKSNSIGPKGGAAIAKALQLNDGLTILDISYNKINDSAGFELASMLQVNNRLEELDVTGCGLDSGSLIAFSTVLINNETLTSISFADNRSHFSSLSQTLQHDTIKHVSSMLKQNTTLRKLSISKLGITDWATIDLLAPVLGPATTLNVLDLSCNKIGRDGAVAIFKSLRKNETLSCLKMGCCAILDEGAEAAGDMLIQNNSIEKLYLEYNGITGVGLIAIAKGLSRNKSLKTLALWGNDWDVAACEAFAPLAGGVARENSVGKTDDVLPDSLSAPKLKNLKVMSNGVYIIDAQSKEFNPKNFVAKKLESYRLEKNQIDFVIYAVEGVHTVAKSEIV